MVQISDYIIDRQLLVGKLSALRRETQPLWGKMQAQQMIAHLADEVKWSNGEEPCSCLVSKEQAIRNKGIMIYSPIAIPKNFYIGDLPAHYLFLKLEHVLDELMQQLECFDRRFLNAKQTEMHPRFGPLSRKEWLVWQQKHFSHHLMQFSLIPESNCFPDMNDLVDCI